MLLFLRKAQSSSVDELFSFIAVIRAFHSVNNIFDVKQISILLYGERESSFKPDNLNVLGVVRNVQTCGMRSMNHNSYY